MPTFEPLVKVDRLSAKDEQEIIKYVREDIESVSHIFQEKHSEANRNYDFYFGRQLTQEELLAHEQQRRIPYVFNEVKHKVDHLIGVQMQTRLDVKAVGREPGDEAAAELLTFILKWVSQVNDLESIETEVFKDGIIANVGWGAVYWEDSDVTYGYPKVEIVPYNEIYYDAQSIKRDLSDARWIARRAFITRLDAKEKYPWLADEIDKEATSGSLSQTIPLFKQQMASLSAANRFSSQDKDILEEITHYEKVKIAKYMVIDDIAGEIKTFNVRKDAEEYYKGIVEGYSEEGIPIVYEDGSMRVLFTTQQETKLMLTVVVGNFLAVREMTILPDFPYVPYFPYFAHGDYQSFVDQLISPQILINRSFSQWDYLLGASHKNVITVMESLLKRGWTAESVAREISKTAPIIPVMNHGALNAVPNNPVNPQIFQNIEFGISRMNDYAGGRNSLGLQENAAESGRAVIARAEQGGVSKLPLFDALRLWRLRITQIIVWYIQNFMSERQIMRIIGDDKDVHYVNLTPQLMNTLKELKVDIIVDEAIKSETMKERNFTQILQFSQIAQLPPEITVPIFLEYSSLPQSKKEEIKSQLEFYKEYMQQKAQMMQQEKIKREVEASIARKQLKAQYELGDEMAATNEEIQRQAREVATKLENLQKMKQQAEQEEAEQQALQQMQQQLALMQQAQEIQLK